MALSKNKGIKICTCPNYCKITGDGLKSRIFITAGQRPAVGHAASLLPARQDDEVKGGTTGNIVLPFRQQTEMR
jgi:hypothetical protein